MTETQDRSKAANTLINLGSNKETGSRVCVCVCVFLCMCAATCSGQSGASIRVLNGLAWMALRGLSWSMPVSAGPMVSPLTTRCSTKGHCHCICLAMLQCRQWTSYQHLNHSLPCACRRVCCTGAMLGQTRLSASTWRPGRTGRWCWPTTTTICSPCLCLRATSTGVTGKRPHSSLIWESEYYTYLA